MGRGRPRKYPWANWLDGERYVLNSQQHFPDVDVRSLRQQALTEAAKRGVEITTRIAADYNGSGVDYLLIERKKPMKSKRFDWDEVFSNLPRTFVHGEDFGCSLDAMRVRIYQAAQRRGPLPVRIERDGSSISIYPVREEPVTEMAPDEGE